MSRQRKQNVSVIHLVSKRGVKKEEPKYPQYRILEVASSKKLFREMTVIHYKDTGLGCLLFFFFLLIHRRSKPLKLYQHLMDNTYSSISVNSLSSWVNLTVAEKQLLSSPHIFFCYFFFQKYLEQRKRKKERSINMFGIFFLNLH